MEKKYVISIVVIVVLVIAVISLIMVHNRNENQVATQTIPTSGTLSGTDQASSTPTTTPASSSTSGHPAPMVSTSNTLYNKYLPDYESSGHRIQLVASCDATPYTLSIKMGQTFMVDNRNAQSDAISVEGQNFTIPGYGFALVSAFEKGTYFVSCDKKNSATIKIE